MESTLYKTHARKETHPARIGALGRLYGIATAPCERCDVLEIGCGDGGNLIPLAVRYPESRFVGIDLSAELVAKGRQDIATLGLENIELARADVSTYEAPVGAFDYIICHGVYSWVAAETQEAILRVAQAALREYGVFLCSYNTYPGWRQRGAVRDVMRVGAAGCAAHASDRERYAAGMSFLELVSGERKGGGDPFGAYLRESYERLLDSDPGYVIQEFLQPHNAPLLFRDFMELARSSHLQFMSEARVVMMSADDLGSSAKDYLESLGEDVIAREQALDMMRNRMFRETLLCHERLSLRRGLSTEAFRALCFVANYIPLDDSPECVRFSERATGKEVTTPAGECSAMLGVAASLGARGGTVADIIDASRGRFLVEEREALSIIATLWRSGFLDALTSPLVEEGELVRVSPLARLQAERGVRVTSALHDSYALTPLERKAIVGAQEGMTVTALSTLLLADAPQADISAMMRALVDRGLLM